MLWAGRSRTLTPSTPNRLKALEAASRFSTRASVTRKRYQTLLGTIHLVAPYVLQGKYRLRQLVLHAPRRFSQSLTAPLSEEFRNHLV